MHDYMRALHLRFKNPSHQALESERKMTVLHRQLASHLAKPEVEHKENGDSIFCYIAYQGIDLTEQSRMTLSEWLDQWLEQMAVTLRPGTLEHYCRDTVWTSKP